MSCLFLADTNNETFTAVVHSEQMVIYIEAFTYISSVKKENVQIISPADVH